MKSLKDFSFKHPFARLVEKAMLRGPVFTSLDAMKWFAVMNMTADHIGFYFFPHDLWWRAIGRITFPVWFFLVGFTKSRTLPFTLWIYSLLLVVDHLLVGRPLFPLNALVSIILCRLLLNLCESYYWMPKRLPELMTGCVVFSFLTVWFFEYGSIAFLFALFGRMVYVKEKRHFLALAFVSYMTFIGWQIVDFSDFTPPQLAYVIVGSAWVVYWLARCPIYTVWPDWTTSWWKTGATLLSRNTLPYYFYHRLLFEILSAVLLGGGIGFSVKWFIK